MPDSGPTATQSRAATSERRPLTILFADIAGSTSIAENLDPEDWTALVQKAFRTGAGLQTLTRDLETLLEARRGRGKTRATEPAKRLLRAMPGKQRSEREAQDQKRETPHGPIPFRVPASGPGTIAVGRGCSNGCASSVGAAGEWAGG